MNSTTVLIAILGIALSLNVIVLVRNRSLWSSFSCGLRDWKMPLFRGFLYGLTPALTAIYAGLQDYKAWVDIDDLAWFKIKMSAAIGAASGVAAFLDSSFARTSDTLKARRTPKATK